MGRKNIMFSNSLTLNIDQYIFIDENHVFFMLKSSMYTNIDNHTFVPTYYHMHFMELIDEFVEYGSNFYCGGLGLIQLIGYLLLKILLKYEKAGY